MFKDETLYMIINICERSIRNLTLKHVLLQYTQDNSNNAKRSFVSSLSQYFCLHCLLFISWAICIFKVIKM